MQLHLLDPPRDEPADDTTTQIQVLRLARAAEHLVCSDILQRGFDAQMASEGLAYDVIADIGGLRRIQVKSTRLQNRPVTANGRVYDYEVYRFKGGGNGGKRLRDYRGLADLFAFVAIDCRMIVYARPDGAQNEYRISREKLTPEYCDLSWQQGIGGW